MKSLTLFKCLMIAVTCLVSLTARADNVDDGGGVTPALSDGGVTRRPGHGDLRDWRYDQHLVRLLYEAVLFRRPSDQEMNGWVQAVNQGGYNGLLNVAQGIGGSPEARQNLYNRGSQAVLDNIYSVIFRRGVDPAGEGWISMLNENRGGELLRDIVSSEEYANDYLR